MIRANVRPIAALLIAALLGIPTKAVQDLAFPGRRLHARVKFRKEIDGAVENPVTRPPVALPSPNHLVGHGAAGAGTDGFVGGDDRADHDVDDDTWSELHPPGQSDGTTAGGGGRSRPGGALAADITDGAIASSIGKRNRGREAPADISEDNEEENTTPQKVSPPPTAGGAASPQPNPFHLPAFEKDPAPPNPTFREWQAGFQAARRSASKSYLARIRGAVPPAERLHPASQNPNAYEFTSREGLGPEAPPPGAVAACLVARDAHDDLGEWIHHHLKLGISKIYVYDHASSPPMMPVVQTWVRAGAVEYTHFTSFNHSSGRPQLYGYDRCLHEQGHKHTWLAFFDVDEYLVFQNGPPVQHLPTLLQKYSKYSALAVHWIMFGSSGREFRPSRGTLRSYTRCLPRNHTHHLYVKTIANTACTVRVSDSPHAFVHNCSRPAVRTNFAPVHGQTANDLPVHAVLALHHYAVRSAEEFEVKMARGSGMKRQRGWEYFQFMDQWSVEYCLQGLAVWDDNVVTLPRTLDPGQVTAQLEAYAKEDHEDFWGAKAAAAKAAQTAAREAEAEASNWGKEGDEDDEEDEHGGERDDGGGEEEAAMARRRLIEGGRQPPAVGPQSGDYDEDASHELRRLHAAL